MEYPFGRNRDGYSNTVGYADQVFMKEMLANTRRKATSMSLLIQRVWEGTRDVLKEDITEKVGYIVVVKIMN